MSCSAAASDSGITTRVPPACGTRSASACPPSTMPPAVSPQNGLPKMPPDVHEVCTPSEQQAHELSENANGATTRSPTAMPVTSGPTSSTTPTNSWPRRRPGVMPRASP